MVMGSGVEVRRRLHYSKKQRSGCQKNQQTEIETKTPISMLEAATILMAMAYSVSDVEAFCNHELQNISSKKRKRAATKQPTKKNKNKKKKKPELTSTPEMPAAARSRISEMGGYGIQLVIQKQLEDTDLNKNLGRLSLPAKKLKVEFATEEERKVLSEKVKKNKKGMNVAIIDPLLRETSICLKKWKIGSDDVYILTTHWNSFVQENGFKTGDNIQLWCFRKDEFQVQTQTIVSRLCFAMVKLHATA